MAPIKKESLKFSRWLLLLLLWRWCQCFWDMTLCGWRTYKTFWRTCRHFIACFWSLLVSLTKLFHWGWGHFSRHPPPPYCFDSGRIIRQFHPLIVFISTRDGTFSCQQPRLTDMSALYYILLTCVLSGKFTSTSLSVYTVFLILC
jgi:hypothetical protein